MKNVSTLIGMAAAFLVSTQSLAWSWSTGGGSSAGSFDDEDEDRYVCAYFVDQPGLVIQYFADTGDSKSRTKWMAEKICEYNKGRPFGLEVCDEITCRRN